MRPRIDLRRSPGPNIAAQLAPLGDRKLHERVKFAAITMRSPPPEAGRKTVSRNSGMDARIHVIMPIPVPKHSGYQDRSLDLDVDQARRPRAFSAALIRNRPRG